MGFGKYAVYQLYHCRGRMLERNPHHFDDLEEAMNFIHNKPKPGNYVLYNRSNNIKSTPAMERKK